MGGNQTRYPRRWEWPNGERIALTINLAFEAFRFASQYMQGARPGSPDQFSLSYGEYGARSGIWRLMDLLGEYGLKGSCSVNGYAAELYPHVVKALSDEGHELVGHGWQNDVIVSPDDPEAVRREIADVTSAIEVHSGQRPVGWVGPGSAGSAKTFAILTSMGYLWNGDLANDDLPYLRDTPEGPIVIMPRINMPHNDLSIWQMGRHSPEVIWEMFRNTFDQLYMEGKKGSPKAIEITLHAHIAGRPTLVPIIRRCLDYSRGHDGVLYARKREIAAWAVKQHEVATGRIAGERENT